MGTRSEKTGAAGNPAEQARQGAIRLTCVWSGRSPVVLHSKLLRDIAGFGALRHRDGLLVPVTSDLAARGFHSS